MLLQSAQLLALACAILIALPSPVRATIAGDCRPPFDQTTIDEVQSCANIFLGTAAESSCPACTRTARRVWAIHEVLSELSEWRARRERDTRDALPVLQSRQPR